MYQSSTEKPDILIATVTEVEQDAVLRSFKAAVGKSCISKGRYIDLGIICKSRVWMVISGMGPDGTTGSMLTIEKAIDETSPEAVIMVGIAFGVDDKKQQIGDVLVSEMIVPYENQRVGKNRTDLRGPRPPASANLIQIFRTAAAKWREEGGAPVYFGPMLSGNKLIDNLEFRDQLVEATGAIGGEMEGSGLCFAAHDKKTDWILIKGICDWADGHKGENKKERQALAAENSAAFTLYVLKNNNITQSGRDSGIKFNTSPSTEIASDIGGTLQRGIDRIHAGLNSANYRLAQENGLETIQQLGEQFEHEDPEIELLFGEFWVSYALALIYSGGKLEGKNGGTSWLSRVIDRLEKRKSLYLKQDGYTQQRFHLVLGRAYNHLGYSYWMDRGHYEAALSKFNKALECFTQGKWKQETATTYDNLARVYATIGYRSHAEFLCTHGLRLRGEYLRNKNDKENQYRYALSLNSIAIIHLNYGQSLRAYLESEKALDIFEQCTAEKGERGVGLALITRSVAARMLGSHWRFTDNTKSSEEYLEKAACDLLRAEGIFRRIDEDIRLIQVYNELGCVYREYCALYDKAGREEESRHAEKRARRFFSKILSATENAEKYPAALVDTYHDFAQTIYAMSEGSDSDIDKLEIELKSALDDAERIIPEHYRFPNSSNHFLQPVEDCFEDYWQDLGKIYALRGDLVFRELSSFASMIHQRKQLRRERIIESFKFYLLAAAYFSRYLERPISGDNSFYPDEPQELEKYFQYSHNLYDRLCMLDPEEISFVRNKLCQQIIDEYDLEPKWIDRFFKQPFDLLLRRPETLI